MRQFSLVILSLALIMGGVFSCKKWTDPAPTNDPRLTNPYCNDPDAVNYNWGFPGKPDNTVCFYAADMFAGQYMFFDTVYLTQSDLYISADSLLLNISKVTNTKINIEGLCSSGKLAFTAISSYVATSDTTVGDSLTMHPGQFFCRTQDTLVGTFTRDKVDSSIVYVQLTVRSDTGTTVHIGRAIKK